MSRLKEQYQNEIVDAMIKKFGYKNIMEVPKLDKVVINMGVGDAKENAKLLESAIADMEKIAGQKAVVTRAKNSVANFKIREGMPIGCCGVPTQSAPATASAAAAQLRAPSAAGAPSSANSRTRCSSRSSCADSLTSLSSPPQTAKIMCTRPFRSILCSDGRGVTGRHFVIFATCGTAGQAL